MCIEAWRLRLQFWDGGPWPEGSGILAGCASQVAVSLPRLTVGLSVGDVYGMRDVRRGPCGVVQ